MNFWSLGSCLIHSQSILSFLFQGRAPTVIYNNWSNCETLCFTKIERVILNSNDEWWVSRRQGKQRRNVMYLTIQHPGVVPCGAIHSRAPLTKRCWTHKGDVCEAQQTTKNWISAPSKQKETVFLSAVTWLRCEHPPNHSFKMSLT